MTQQSRMVLAGAAATALSATTLLTVFKDQTWVLPALLALVVGVGGCEAARQLGAPRAAVPVIGLLALALVLMVEFAAAEAWLLVIPNGAVAGRIGDLVTQARHDIRALSAPVVVRPGTALLASAGVGLVAVVVDTLAVTLRRPAVAGFALVALFVVPAAVSPNGVSPVTFVLGAAGYLALLLTDGRAKVNRWGRSLDRRRDRSSPVALAGRRLGVATVGAAVLVPVLLPGLDDGLVTGGSGSFGRAHSKGGHSVLVNNPIIALDKDLNRPDPVEVIQYRTKGDSSYLRLVSLDDFTGDVWAPRKLQVKKTQRVEDGLGTPVGLVASTKTSRVRYDIDVKELDSKWLPLPYPAARVTGIGPDWVWERNTFNVYPLESDQSIRRKSYQATTVVVQPTVQQLRDAPDPVGLDPRFLTLPTDLPASISTAAEQVTKGKKNGYDRALALQDWLRSSDFVYDTTAPSGTGMANIAAFLKSRKGFCVHYASTMAVMARYLGIPARIGVGYTGGTSLGSGTDTWSISSSDAHAWPELYFQGAGWLKFEPTPSARVGAVRPSYAVDRTPTAAALPSIASSAAPSTTAGARPDIDSGVAATSAGGGTGSGWGVDWLVVVAVLGVLGVAASPATVRIATRRRRWRRATTPVAVADTAWRELHDLAVDYGLDLPGSLTPRQYADRLSEAAWLAPDARSAVATMARAAERSHYARDVGEVGDLRARVAVVESGLGDARGRVGRLRARVLPASTLAWRHDAGERAAAGLERLDDGLSGAVARLVPRALRSRRR